LKRESNLAIAKRLKRSSGEKISILNENALLEDQI